MRSAARRTAAAALAVTMAGGLSSCGEDPIERYCAEVAAQQTALTEAAAATDGTGLLRALPSFEALRAEAPGDIAADWSVVVQRITALRDALDAGGVDPATYDPQNPPADLSDDDQAAIAGAATGLVTDAMTEALGSVQQQARDVCQNPLSL